MDVHPTAIDHLFAFRNVFLVTFDVCQVTSQGIPNNRWDCGVGLIPVLLPTPWPNTVFDLIAEFIGYDL